MMWDMCKMFLFLFFFLCFVFLDGILMVEQMIVKEQFTGTISMYYAQLAAVLLFIVNCQLDCICLQSKSP